MGRAPQGGSDVITKTALKRINWSLYKINQTTDKVGVFVSIVSTKIPYKGAGKEYIGEAIPRPSPPTLRSLSLRVCQNAFCHGLSQFNDPILPNFPAFDSGHSDEFKLRDIISFVTQEYACVPCQVCFW